MTFGHYEVPRFFKTVFIFFKRGVCLSRARRFQRMRESSEEASSSSSKGQSLKSLTNEKHPYGSLICAPTTFQGRPSKMPSQITMPKPKEKERVMLLSLLGTPGKQKKKGRKPPPSLLQTKHKSVKEIPPNNCPK